MVSDAHPHPSRDPPAAHAGGRLLAGALAPTATGAVAPQPPPARPAPLANYVTNGTVDALARDGGTLFLGGAFSRIGPPTGGGVALDPATGPPATHPDVRGIGFAIVPDAAGGDHLGGRFTHVGGLPRKNSRTCSPTAPSIRRSRRRPTATC